MARSFIFSKISPALAPRIIDPRHGENLYIEVNDITPGRIPYFTISTTDGGEKIFQASGSPMDISSDDLSNIAEQLQYRFNIWEGPQSDPTWLFGGTFSRLPSIMFDEGADGPVVEPPVSLGPIPDQTWQEGVEITEIFFGTYFTAQNGIYTIDPAISGLNLTTSGSLTGTPDTPTVGIQAVTVTVTNSAGSTLQSFNIEVQPTVAADNVPNQSANFGALTRFASVNGYQIVDNGGQPVTNAVDVGGNLTGYVLTPGGLLYPSGDGLFSTQHGNTLDITCDQGAATITLDVIANTYSVGSAVEFNNAEAAIGAAGGKTILLRPITIVDDNDRKLRNTSFTAPLIIDAEPGCVWDGSMEIENAQNWTLRNLEIRSTAADGNVLQIIGACDNYVIEDNVIHGEFRDPLASYAAAGAYTNPAKGINFGIGASGKVKGGTIRRNKIYDVVSGMSLGIDGASGLTVADNEIYRTYSDSMQVTLEGAALTAPIRIQRNFCYDWVGSPSDADNPHIDVLQFLSNAANNGLEATNVIIEGNVAQMTTGARGRSVQGIASFDDGGNRMTFKNPILRENLMAIDGNHHMTLKVNGGTIERNTLVHPGPGWDTTAQVTPRVLLNTSTGTVTITRNITEAAAVVEGAATVLSNNVAIGLKGATHTYANTFDGPFPILPATNYLAAFKYKVGGPADVGGGAGAIGTVATTPFSAFNEAGSATITSMAALRVSINNGAWQTPAAAGLTITGYDSATSEFTITGLTGSETSIRLHYEQEQPGEPYSAANSIDAIYTRAQGSTAPALPELTGMPLLPTYADTPIIAELS